MSKIISCRGTSGSGKTTLARRIMAHYPKKYLHFEHGPVLGKTRRAPLWYDLGGSDMHDLRVLGAYEAVSGGADGISGTGSLDYVAQLAREGAQTGKHVFYEGLVQGSDMKRLPRLQEQGHDVLVIILSTSIDDCLASVRARREAKGNTKPLDETSTRDKHWGLLRSIDRLRAMGVRTEHLDREAAYQLVARELGLRSDDRDVGNEWLEYLRGGAGSLA